MTLVVKTNPNGLPLRYYAAPTIALSLATIRAMGADIENVVIWRGHPDAALVCVKLEGGDLVLSSGEPYCRSGVVEWLDGLDDPFEASQKLIRYSADYNVVGLQVYARGSDAILEAAIYAPGAAVQMGLPPVDAVIEIEYYGTDLKVESFYDLFRYDYKKYAEFVRNLAEELEPISVETKKGRIELPPVYFIERIDAIKDVDDYRDITRTVPLHRHKFVDSVVSDVIWRFKPKRPVDVQSIWNDVYEAAKRAFTWAGDLLLPRSPEAYDEIVSYIINLLKN